MCSDDYKAHTCPFKPEGVHVEYTDAPYIEGSAWRLRILRLATEDDVMENHHLETIDDLIWETGVRITHCPFCGAMLTDEHLGEAQMYHIDSSGSNIKFS
jgi:hypothetical protein